jgi:hypothetical protein
LPPFYPKRENIMPFPNGSIVKLRPKGLIFCSSDLNVPNNIRFSVLNGILKRSIMT